MVLKRIEPISFAKIAGILYACIGIIAGLFMWMFSGLMSGIGGPDAAMFTSMFGIGSIIIFPILYGIIGFLFGFVAAALYNVVADRIGGIEVDLS